MDRIDGESEIEGTTNKVASIRLDYFTLESDSLSEAPLSARSKRRKKASKKERNINTCMDIDSKAPLPFKWNYQQIKVKMPSNSKFLMDWEGVPQSDVSSPCSSCSDNHDADDEQSDWPEYKKEQDCTATFSSSSFLTPPVAIPNSLQKRIERFLYDPSQKEMVLQQIYKPTNIKKFLKDFPVQIQKRERGTFILKKSLL